jgi:hypothetical protein
MIRKYALLAFFSAAAVFTTQAQTITYRNVTTDAGYSMDIPKNMTTTDDLNDVASLQYQDIEKELYVIVIDEAKDEFIDAFTEEGTYKGDLGVAENYGNIQMASMESAMNITSNSGAKTTTINGREANMYEVEATVEGVDYPIYYLYTFVEGKEKVYMVMAWTLLEHKDKFRDVLMKTAKSLNEI